MTYQDNEPTSILIHSIPLHKMPSQFVLPRQLGFFFKLLCLRTHSVNMRQYVFLLFKPLLGEIAKSLVHCCPLPSNDIRNTRLVYSIQNSNNLHTKRIPLQIMTGIVYVHARNDNICL